MIWRWVRKSMSGLESNAVTAATVVMKKWFWMILIYRKVHRKARGLVWEKWYVLLFKYLKLNACRKLFSNEITPNFDRWQVTRPRNVSPSREQVENQLMMWSYVCLGHNFFYFFMWIYITFYDLYDVFIVEYKRWKLSMMIEGIQKVILWT